ncbi:prepilin-type N-terminal cleavage/methylation domain-containing protein [Zobellella maritima]|uniref:prepilin-type N-terminal cleavage/methylation domain-containing protein n=1 Tax=Zobellella maritima TaxID=2059725 RepID=UPI000E305396|nr:prepilin-type N-terminal cleavage/methylation domain-containing protein [Zobellella maritima]
MKRQAGFGLVEVVIAFIVVAVTAGSLLQLNKVYLEYSRDGRSREVALRLAESKLDELRHFNDKLGYQNISGGSQTTVSNGVTYNLGWTVTDYGWDTINTKWTTPLPSGTTSGKKEVAVTVDWSDNGEPQSFTLSSVVSPQQLYSGLSGGGGGGALNFGLGLGGPKVAHSPGTIPNVIPISLGDGLTQETSRPLPKLAQQGGSDSLRVAFKTNAYDNGSKTSQVQDITTVSCNCKLDDATSASLPSQRIALGGLSYWTLGGTAVKSTGKPKSSQDPLCVRCCKNHFDGDLNEFGHWYDVIKRSNTPPHGHYKDGVSLATLKNTEYLEACRMVRINGFYEMANDWNLVAFNIFDASIFADSAVLSAYQSYVKEVVTDYIRGQVKAGSNYTNQTYSTPVSFSTYLTSKGIAPLSTDMLLVAPGPDQLIARGIYVDIVSPEYRQYLKDEVMGGNPDATPENLLKFVPFYDVNLTLLANWTSNDSSNTSVTNEPVQTIVDSSQQYYGTYSRGLINALKEGSLATITATIRRSNSGITSFKPLSTDEITDVKSSSLNVSVQVLTGKVSITGQIKCITYETVGTIVTEQACDDTQLSLVQVSFTQAGISSISCSSTQVTGQGANKGNLSVSYNCYANNGPTATLTATAPAGYELILPGTPWSVSTNISQGKKAIEGGCLLAVINRAGTGKSLPGSCN